jgi:hypothetical protein
MGWLGWWRVFWRGWGESEAEKDGTLRRAEFVGVLRLRDSQKTRTTSLRMTKLGRSRKDVLLPMVGFRC